MLALAVAAAWALLGRSADEGAPGDDVRREEAGEGSPDDVRLAGRDAGPDASEAANEHEPGTARIVVRALAYGTGEPLVGVRLAVVDAGQRRVEGVTGAKGEVVLSGLAPGEARVEGADPGWVAGTDRIELVEDEVGEVALRFRHALSATGRVLAAPDGTPVEGAVVVAAADGTVGEPDDTVSGNIWSVTKTDAEGRFVLAAIPRGETFTLTVHARGRARRIQNVMRHEPGAAKDIMVWLHPGGRLRGVVVAREGRGLARLRVFVYPDGDEILAEDPRGAWTDGFRSQAALTGTTDEDGRFVVAGLALGARYAATAYGADGLRAVDVHGIVATETVPEPETRLVIPDPATLVVGAHDPDGNRLPGCRAVIGPYAFGRGMNDAQGEADASGRVVLSGLAAGEIEVRVEADGHLAHTVGVLLVEGETRELDVRLERGLSITGVVEDARGRPLPDIHVRLKTRDGGQASSVKTNGAGRFEADGLQPGTYRVDARGPGYQTPEEIEVEAPATDVRLVCRRLGRVTGRLVLPPGSTPPDRIQVGCYASSGGGWAHQNPWNDGRFEMTAGRDSRILKIQGEGFAPLVREFRAGFDEVVDLGDIRLSVGVSLRGVAVDAAGRPVAGAAVTAGEHEWRATQTDPEGRFELAHLAPDDLWVTVEVEGFVDRVIRPSASDLAGPVRIVLSRGGLLRVRVLDAEGLPVVDADVSIGSTDVTYAGHPGDNFTAMAWAYTDETGRVAVRLATGRYRIVASRGEKTLATGTATLREGEATEVVLRP